jgi:hypothetical protein
MEMGTACSTHGRLEAHEGKSQFGRRWSTRQYNIKFKGVGWESNGNIGFTSSVYALLPETEPEHRPYFIYLRCYQK